MKKLLVMLLLFCCFSILSYAKVTYSFNTDPVDVIIPCTSKDLDTLEHCIKGIRENCKQVRRIIIISDSRLTHNAEWFDEKKFPFDKKGVALYLCKGDTEAAANYLTGPNQRVGWYYQQLLKLYAPFVIPGISTNVLHLDSDTIFLKQVTFFDDAGNGLYNPGTEYHMPYFTHLDRLIPGIKRVFSEHSGISHHMLLQLNALEDLFNTVETYHQTELWKAFCLTVDIKDLYLSGAASDEIYFNFVFTKTDQVKLRFFKWDNIPRIADIPTYKNNGYHYVSIHSWMRQP